MLPLEEEEEFSRPSWHSSRRLTRFHYATLLSITASSIIVISMAIALLVRTQTIVHSQAEISSILNNITQNNRNDNQPSGDNSNKVLEGLSQYMNSLMDKSVDPCNDFYQYTCGNWIKNTKIPDDKSTWAISFSFLQDNALKVMRDILEEDWPIIGPFYRNCMDMNTINAQGSQPLTPWLNQIDSIDNNESLMIVLGQLQRSGISGGALFSFYVDADPKEPSTNLITIWQDGLGLPDRDYYFTTDENAALLKNAYLNHVSNVLQLIGIEKAQANTHAQNIFAFETKLANVSLTNTQLRDPNLVYNKKTLEELQQLTPGLPWLPFFQSIQLNSISTMNVAQPGFISGMFNSIQSTPIDTIKIYLKAHLAMAASPYLSQTFLDESFNYSSIVYGARKPPERWKKCASLTDNRFGELLGRYYVNKHFPGDSKKIAQNLVNGLEAAFLQNLNDGVSWMDSTTKQRASEKLNMISNKIGYPDKWTNYDSIFIQPGNFFENILVIGNFSNDKEVSKAGKPVDKTQWFMTPATVNAYYNPTANEIVFPAAILQPPFFNSSYPAFANFGAIGAIIGHEITHGFDDSGRQYAGDGTLYDWWTSSSTEAFEQKAQCVVDRYNSYEVLPNLFINGRLTEGENLADLGGLRIAYLAYLNWLKEKGQGDGIDSDSIKRYFPEFSEEQLFFITFGQVWCNVATDAYKQYLTRTNPHSYDKFRAIGATSNLEYFWDAFKCKEGSPMRPANSCRVW